VAEVRLTYAVILSMSAFGLAQVISRGYIMKPEYLTRSRLFVFNMVFFEISKTVQDGGFDVEPEKTH
jgi:hypothetical protein